MNTAASYRLAPLITLLASGPLLLAPHESLAQTPLYAGIGRGAPDKGAVITINQTTGGGTPLGTGAADPMVGINGLAFDSSGDFFASTISAPLLEVPQGVGTLITIDPATGEELAFIGDITLNGDPLAINDLSVQPGTDLLFGISIDTTTFEGSLYTIDKSTGVATLVGGTGRITATIAFGPDGTLYATSATFDDNGFVGGFLHTLDQGTGTVLTTVGPFLVHIGGLAVRPTDGVIFASGGMAGDIYTLVYDGRVDTCRGDRARWCRRHGVHTTADRQESVQKRRLAHLRVQESGSVHTVCEHR